MRLSYNYSESILLINPEITLLYFLERCGGRNNHAKEMFTRIYNSIYSELIDVKEEYEKFYSFEYDSIEIFLYKKYNLIAKDITSLMSEWNKKPYCVLYRTNDDCSYGDHGIVDFIYSDVMHDRIMGILTTKFSI